MILISILFSLSFLYSQDCDLTILTTESIALSLSNKGHFVTTTAYQPKSDDIWIQYRKVKKITKVVIGWELDEPMYYVCLGKESDYQQINVKSPTPPWKKKTDFSQGPFVFKGSHNHMGCSEKEVYCKKHPGKVTFPHLKQGNIIATSGKKNTQLEGVLRGNVFSYTYFAGRAGTGRITFSNDFTEFTGTFDDTVHRGMWDGYKLISP